MDAGSADACVPQPPNLSFVWVIGPCCFERHPARVSNMTEKLTRYEPAAALVNEEEIAAFLADALETGDAAFIATALEIVAHAKRRIPLDKAQRGGECIEAQRPAQK